MKFNHIIASLLAIWMFSADLAAQDSLDVQKINNNFYIALGGNGKGAHTGIVLGKDGIVIIDAMMEESQQSLLKTIRQISDKPVRFIMNTHDHFDHTGGNSFFTSQGAILVAQENAVFDQAFPSLTFRDKLSLKHFTEEIQAFQVSSHSPSDSIIYMPGSNVIFMGDVFTNEWYPALFHGGIQGQNKALDLALSLMNDETVVVPGHGVVTNRKGVLNYRNDSIAWVRKIMDLHSAGLSSEKIIEDPELRSIQTRFNTTNKNPDNFNKWFKQLVENTIAIETDLSKSP